MRTYHDFASGDMLRLGPILVTRADVLDFHKRFDGAADLWTGGPPTRFTAPVASPLLVQALVLGALINELKAQDAAVLALPQFDALRFPAPVRAYDRLRVDVEVEGRQMLGSGDGLVRLGVTACNQDRLPVFTGTLSLPVEARARVQVVERLGGLS
jgi:acyl dehydratase